MRNSSKEERMRDTSLFLPVKTGGFTLTELALVLGIMGLILGAIWTATSKASANNKVTKGAREVLAIVEGVRAIYAARGMGNGAAQVDITQALINFGVYPADMITPTCAAGVMPDGITTSCPISPWGEGVSVYIAPISGNATEFSLLGGPNYFEIVSWGGGDPAVTTNSNCTAFMYAVLTAGRNEGLVGAYTQSSTTFFNSNTFAITPTTPITLSMVSGCQGNETFMFKL